MSTPPESGGAARDVLFTPWRYAYIRSKKDPSEGCIFCAAAARPEAPESLVVALGEHHLVMLNRHPYTNGHLMVVPRYHHACPSEESPIARGVFWEMVLETQRVLQKAYQPDGLNLGMNVGSAAGAGLPGHFHFHVVPRWVGDTNFMSVMGNVRVVPEDLEGTRLRLIELFREEES